MNHDYEDRDRKKYKWRIIIWSNIMNKCEWIAVLEY